MSNANLTVRAALSTRGRNDPPESPDRWTMLKERFRNEARTIQWMATMPDMAEMLGELFDIPIPGIMLGAWRKADEVARVIQESETSPDDVMYVDLTEHTIERHLEPYIEIRVEGLPPKRLYFQLDLTFTIKGFRLRIQAGEIRDILTGQCELGGKILFNRVELLRKEFEPIQLPGSIMVKENGRSPMPTTDY